MQVHFPALKSYAYVLEADRHTPLTGIAHSGIGGGIGHGIRRGGSLLNLSFHHQRSEEHTSELQSQSNLVCRLLLEKKKVAPHAHINASSLSKRGPLAS